MPTLALPDANVLHSRTLRDWLLLLKVVSGGGMFQVAYTEDILAETMYHVRRRNLHLSGTQITLVRDQIVGAMDLRIAEYPSGQEAVQVRDPFDRHIHAAAVAGDMDCIITHDKGFTELPVCERDQLEYEIYTADEFFTLVDDSSPSTVLATLRRQIEYRSRKPDARYDFVDALIAADCPVFAGRVRTRCQQLAVSRS